MRRLAAVSAFVVFTFGLVALPTTALAQTPSPAIAVPSRVLPASATPLGYSLTDMTKDVALFTTSGNDPNYYPGAPGALAAGIASTPFQILHYQQGQTESDFIGDCAPVYTGSCGVLFLGLSGGTAGTFTVKPGTMFYVPIANLDDSPPVIGTYPTTPEGAKLYFFDPKQGGGQGMSITIDGTTTPLDNAAYVAGPVTTPMLLDGGGTHMITLGVFVTALTPGAHQVEMTATQSSPAIRAAYGFDFLRSDFKYVVDVSQH